MVLSQLRKCLFKKWGTFWQDISSFGKDIEYIVNCCRTNREDRLPTCYFWKKIVDALGKIEKDPEKIYKDFEKKICEVCAGNHIYWCLYCPPDDKYWGLFYSEDDKKKWYNIRKGVKNLGNALHDECHGSLELTQQRLLGAGLKIGKFKDEYKGKYEKNIERFRRHYHEFGCLKAAFISEINLRENKKSTHSNIVVFSISSLLAVITAEKFSLISNVFDILASIFLFTLIVAGILYLIECVSLNEAKDAFYICVGVDIDKRKKEAIT